MSFFIHLSPKKIKEIVSPKNLGTSFKPQGCLWFGCGSTWETWIESEGFQPKSPYKYKYEATLNMKKLLVLKTVADIKAFSERYATPDLGIQWNKVRKESGKDGIYIVNGSLKTARKMYPWYSTFDVCSVGVWNKDAVVSMRESKL